MDMPLLEVQGLDIRFKTAGGVFRAVDGISFTAPRGQTTCIVGESGCGKSVTSLAIMGLLDPNAEIHGGQILLEGRDLLQLSQKEMLDIRGREMSMVFQEPMTSLNPVYTVGWQLDEVFRNHGIPKDQWRGKTLDMLDQVGIREPAEVAEKYPHQLSGGMRQRVMIAMALALQPKLLLADEPTTALDVTIQAQVLDLMKDLKQQDTAIILITHDMGVVADMADRVLVMYLGEIVEEGGVFEIFESPRHPYTEGLLRSIPPLYADVDDLPAIPGAVPMPGEILTGCRFAPRCPYSTRDCRETRPTLADVGQNRRVACLRAAELTLKGVES